MTEIDAALIKPLRRWQIAGLAFGLAVDLILSRPIADMLSRHPRSQDTAPYADDCAVPLPMELQYAPVSKRRTGPRLAPVARRFADLDNWATLSTV